jgi:DNA-binding transcriptional LysR family regulator
MNNKIRNIDLNLLKVFDAVMKENNITRAAQSLSVSQPAVSNALRKLRLIYNDQLFVRHAKGVSPTSKAIEIAPVICQALGSVENTIAIDDHFRPDLSHRIFHIAMTDFGEFSYLPLIMGNLHRVAPETVVICHPHEGTTLLREMKSGAIDFVWDWKSISDHGYIVEEIFKEPTCCIVSRNHPIAESVSTLTLEDFLELEHIALRPTRTHVPKIESVLEELGVTRKIIVEVSNFAVMPAIVEGTHLAAIMPESLARQSAQAQNLYFYPNPVFNEPIPVYQIWHKHFENDEGHKWFRSMLKEIISGNLEPL